jgi:hypothetical protein
VHLYCVVHMSPCIYIVWCTCDRASILCGAHDVMVHLYCVVHMSPCIYIVWCTCHRLSIFLLSRGGEFLLFLAPFMSFFLRYFSLLVPNLSLLPFFLSFLFHLIFFIHFVAFCLPSLSLLFLSPYFFFLSILSPLFLLSILLLLGQCFLTSKIDTTNKHCQVPRFEPHTS